MQAAVVALVKEWFGDVDGEGEGLDGGGARPDDDALAPEAHEGDGGAERRPDVGVVAAGAADGAAKLGVAERAAGHEGAARGPHQEGRVDRPRRGEDP